MAADFDLLLALRDGEDATYGGTETATATEIAVALDLLHIPASEVVFEVTTLTATSADEVFTLSVIVDSVLALNSGGAVTLGTLAVTTTGSYVIPIGNGASIAARHATAAYIASKVTISGSHPVIKYSAYVRPIRNPEGKIANRA